MNNAKFGTILAIIAICGWAIFSSIHYYSSPEYLGEVYKAEMATLSGEIQTLRANREKAESEWKKQDTTLSGQINDHKDRLDLLQLCIEAESVRCSEGKKQSYHLITTTYATEYSDHQSASSGLTQSGISPQGKIYGEAKNTDPTSSGSRLGSQDGKNGTEAERVEIVPRFDLSGSHDYREYKTLYPGVAGWKNNNPTGLTYRASRDLEHLWNLAGVSYGVGTARPKNEGGNYYNFPTIEHGLQASIIAKKERWKKATVRQFLKGWGTGQIGGGTPLDSKIGDLTEWQFSNLFIHQMKKESPGLINRLVKDGILIVE